MSHYMADSQNDILMWLMIKTREVKMSVQDLARRLLLNNLADLHSTTSASDDIPSAYMVQT
jgi:hypothetical protein